MYIKGHVKTVYTKDQSNAIVYGVCYVVCRQCQHTKRNLLGWLLKKVMGRNPLNIKEVISTNVYVICIDCVDIYSIECIRNTYA